MTKRPSSRGASGRRICVLCCVFLLPLAGCHHKLLAPQLPPVVVTPDVPPSIPDSPPMESPLPATPATSPPVKVTQTKPKHVPKKSAKAPPVVVETPAPTETAVTSPAPEASPIGELSTGGDANPQKQQEAADLIVSSEGRLNALAKAAGGPKEAQLRQIRNFLRQAKQALSTGDAEGAMTLATKAKLLMDDLTK